MKSLSLFAGVGRADAALEALGIPTAAFSETEDYVRAVMRKRFPNAIDLGDIRGVQGELGEIGVMSGGFPCQDISNAGKRAGIEGSRSSLWSEYARLIALYYPKLVFVENVSALLSRGIDVVLRDLYEIGYACEWDCIPAAAVGAPHLRDRIWMVAYPDSRDPLHVFGEERLERSLGLLEYPPSKWPRAGRMEQGAVWVKEPVARRKTKRLNPGSAWIGVQLSDAHGWWHGPVFPTPSATSYGTNQGGAMGRVGPVRHSLESMARHGMWPTPKSSDAPPGAGMAERYGPGQRRSNLPDAVAYHRDPSTPVGVLNADWVEWLMGMPVGTTDLDCENPVAYSWDREPEGIPRVTEGQPHRKQRLSACGNAQVEQVAQWVAARALERL